MKVLPSSCEEGVDDVALGLGEIVAVHAVTVLDMADDWLDGDSPLHLAFNR